MAMASPFQRLQAELAALISSTPAGNRLPSEPKLAKEMGVSRATLREAMRTFETQGLIRRRQGAGTFVVGQVPVLDAGLEVLESLETMASRMSLNISVSDLDISEIFSDKEFSDVLDVPLATSLTRVQRVMRADSRPVAFLEDVLPAKVLSVSQLPEDFSGSVLDFLLERGDPLAVSRAAISATEAKAEVAKMLEIQRGDVLLAFTSKLYNAAGDVVDFTHSYFLPGYFNFHIVRRVGTP